MQLNRSNNYTHLHVKVSASTNSELIDALEARNIDANHPYMLTAEQQTAGRGQHDRSWQSPEGNVYLSLYHPLNIPLSGLLSLVVGYYLTRLPIIQNINRGRRQQRLPSIGVKWANDIGFYDTVESTSKCNSLNASNHNASNHNASTKDISVKKSDVKQAKTDSPLCTETHFNKLAGILIEPVQKNNRFTGVIVGIGLNVEAAPLLDRITKEGMGYKAVSLNQLIEQTSNLQTNNLQVNSPLSTTSKNITANPKSDKNVELHNQPLVIRPADLYHPIGNSILQAIQCFKGFVDNSHHLHEFLDKYDQVSILTGRKIRLYQKAFSKQNGMNNTLIEGIVIGLNADGSLKIEQQDSKVKNKIIDIYSGTISLVTN